jgi:hypothetical protein
MKNEILTLINRYWKFDDGQKPVSNWHDKQDLLKAVDEALKKDDILSEIKWDIDHDCTKNRYLLSGDLNGHRFTLPVLNNFWGIPLMYKKWCIERRYLALYKNNP